MPLSKTTTDHNEIQKWAENRGGKPACVRRTGSANDAGVLRINFPGYSGDNSLQEISWEEFFQKFDQNGLALVFQEQTAGGERSNFNKLVKRETAEAKARGERTGSGRSKSSSKSTRARSGAAAKSSSEKTTRSRSKASATGDQKSPRSRNGAKTTK